MSADGYCLCPKCHPDGDPYDDETFTVREDYQQGIIDGEYFVRYSAKCRECDFSFSYEHKQKVPL